MKGSKRSLQERIEEQVKKAQLHEAMAEVCRAKEKVLRLGEAQGELELKTGDNF